MDSSQADTVKTAAPVGSKFADQRVTLIHAAMHEFVISRKARAYGLYSLLNLTVLLIQKPVLLVVFKKRPEEAGRTSLKTDQDSDWLHTLRYPSELKKKFDSEIAERLGRPDTFGEWIIPLPKASRLDSPKVDRMYALGVFYLNLGYGHDERYSRDNRYKNAGDRLDPAKTYLEYLNRSDREQISRLYASIAQHQTRSSHGQKDFSHLRHIARYWVFAREDPKLLFPKQKPQFESRVKDIGTEELAKILEPLLNEIDAMYTEMRGGKPGKFDLQTEDESSAPILWSRHRESLASGHGIRPPTIAFFLHLRAPVIPGDNANEDVEHGYRIVPVATPAICLDLAAVLLDYVEQRAKKGLRAKNAAEREVLGYLAQLGIKKPSSEMMETTNILASAIHEAMKIERFLGQQFFHSMTYPAFSSGISTFAPAKACSRCDRVAYGPDFLEEDGGQDTAFVKPTLVSGFPLVSFVTKTRTDIANRTSSDFETFYYNYVFQVGVIRRRASRRIRQAVQQAYLDAIGDALWAELNASFDRFDSVDEGKTVDVLLTRGWIERLNRRLDEIAQAMPYAMVQIHRIGTEENIGVSASNLFVIFDTALVINLSENKYYGRKLIENDSDYLKEDRVVRALTRALDSVRQEWAEMVKRDSRRTS